MVIYACAAQVTENGSLQLLQFILQAKAPRNNSHCRNYSRSGCFFVADSALPTVFSQSLCVSTLSVRSQQPITYYDFPFKHWARIRMNNAIKRLNRGLPGRTRVMDAFPNGNYALMLAFAKLHHAAKTQ